MTQAPPPTDMHMQRSSRAPEEVAALIGTWLTGEVASDRPVVVEVVGGIDTNGLSSDTLVLDARWTKDGQEQGGRYVTRAAPAPEDVPVFPTYAIQAQGDAIRLVGEITDVPVPAVPFSEPTGSVLGVPFFLMEHVDGLVPPDVLPYNFGDNWFADASREQQRALQDATVDVVARLHAIPDAATTFSFLALDGEGSLNEQHLRRVRTWYEFGAADIGRSPLTERALAWLEANVPTPARPDETVLCWGDARIGNVLYRDFEPVAVLDWEMAALGTREIDLSWMVFAHRVFEALTSMMDLPGMPHVLREEDVLATYADRTGVEIGDLTWYYLLHAAQWCCVFLRTGVRQVHFGEIEQPEDPEGLFHHRVLMEKLLDEVGA
ncbi:MAG: phosphotransferase family protein [Nocardioides sp.]|nr:phosphotransferase family protein [Nocardioides sp.]